MSNRAISLLFFAFSLFVVSSVAVAAPPPTTGGGGSGPEQEACSGRAVGDACTLPNRALGTCGQGTCNRLDYSHGSPPKAIEEACVVCQAGHGNGPSLGTGGAPPDDSADDGAASSSSGSSSGAPATKEPPKSESRCQIDATRDPVGVAGLAALLLLASVRRRRT